MDLFTRWGFEQPTMDQLAKTAGVRKATLYVYFDGKSALVDAVVDQWLSEMPYRPVVCCLPLRQQLVGIAGQLQKLSAHPATVALTKWIGEAEMRLHPRQLSAWRGRYAEFESHIAELLRRHCHCENGIQAANQFMLLAVGDLGLDSPAPRATEMERMESAIELTLRAYPQRSYQPSFRN